MKKKRLQLLSSLIAACCAITPLTSSLSVLAETSETTSQDQESQAVNIARLGTAWADSERGGSYGASSINDGNESNLWIANSPDVPVSLGIHLDKIYETEKVRVVFEHRNSTEEHLGYDAYGKNLETGEWVKLGSGSNYSPELDKFESSIELETPFATSEIKLTITERANTQAWPALCEVQVYADPSTAQEIPEDPTIPVNLALNKSIEASGGSGISTINDGNTNGFWDGGVAPAEFTIDLGTGCFIQSFRAITYYGDGRYYHYDIYTSLDGLKFTKAASKLDNSQATSSGDVFELETPINARYVRVNMTYNSANPSVHMREFEVWGTEDPDYTEPEKPGTDVDDPDNIAFNKPVRSNLSHDTKDRINDGSLATKWSGKYYPAYVDIDLLQQYDLTDCIVSQPYSEDRYYYYTIYGSNDYQTWDRLYTKKNADPVTEEGDTIDLSGHSYRFIRYYQEYCSSMSASQLSELRIHGTPTQTNTETIRTGTIDEILDIQDFDDTRYAEPITEQEIIDNVYGIIGRTVGEEYEDWFSFELADNTLNDNDYYEVSMKDGKVHITGNDGVSLASGVNWYYKNKCHVNISEQANQTRMPDSIVSVEGVVRKESPYKIRYGMNYCTIDYTFAFFGADEWQKENDFLALNGINVVLDLAGQEAVWIKFLQNFGYSYDDAKDWIAGPAYYAWQFMDNMETFGGPVSDGWVKDRLEMARENQRWKRSLGMQTVLQGYAGMVPTNFSEYQPDVEILKQGDWCGYDRPDMIRTDGELYDDYAAKFYEAQRWALGETSDYYAADPFHEGGIRPGDLTDDTIAAEVLDSMLKYDQNAVWTVQAWWSNPTNALLKGMGEYRQDHVIVLDLTGLEAPKWNSTSYGSTTLDAKEFNGTDWVWCMLKNYGGNTSVDANLPKLAHDIPDALANSEHMKGIGFISEATYDNPVTYDLLCDMAWTDTEVDLDAWLDDYVLRRYGAHSESARKAWAELQKSVYNRQGNTGQIFTSSPSMSRSPGTGHNAASLEKAINLLLRDYDKLSASEAYRYDLSELIRQHVSDYAISVYNEMKAAYNDKDLELFREKKALFLQSFDMADDIAATQKDMMVGEWIGRAEDWAARYDDFSYDSLTMNAKALITSWGTSVTSLSDYAYRHYSGMLKDLYKHKWQVYLDSVEASMADSGNPIVNVPVFKTYWEWIVNTPEYSRTPNNEPAAMKTLVDQIMKDSTVIKPIPVIPENEGNVVLFKSVTASNYANTGGSNGGYPDFITDGMTSSGYWDSGDWAARPYAIVDLEETYDLDRFTVINYSGNRYYHWELYASEDGENWTLAAEKKDNALSTDAGTTITLDTPVRGRYLKLVAVYHNLNEGWHCRELRAYGELAEQPVQANKMLLSMAIAQAQKLQAEGALEGVNALVVSLFEQSLNEAVEVNEDPSATQERVNEAWRNLVRAIQMLDFRTDFTALDALIAECDALNLDHYANGPVKDAFVEALRKARAVRESETALTDQSIAAAIEELTAARNALLDQSVLDTTLLAFLIDQVSELDLTLYVPEGQEAFQSALQEARNVLDHPENQAQVDAAALNLGSAVLNLRLRPDESLIEQLNSFTVMAMSVDFTGYRAEDRHLVVSALNQILSDLEDENLDQQRAQNDLQLANQALQVIRSYDQNNQTKPDSPKEDQKTPDLSDKEDLKKPDEETEPETNQKPLDQTKPSSQKETVKKSVRTAQKTGFGAVFSLTLASAAGLWLTFRNRKRREEK